MDDYNDENLTTIEALRRQEDDVSNCMNFINLSTNNEIDETCRTSMVVYLQKIGKALKLSPETVWQSISFDRYLSSGKGKSNDALQDKYKFQLVAISSFYIAVKLYEQVELSVGTLAKLCKGYYAESDIIDSEEDILFALDFRLTTPTPMEFIRHYIHLLPSETIDKKNLLKECEKRVEYTSTDIYFTFCKPSCVGASIFTSILLDQDVLSSTQRQTLYLKLAKMTDLIEVMECQKKLGAGKAVSIPLISSVKKSVSKVATTPIVALGDSSPVSVEKTPRAA